MQDTERNMMVEMQFYFVVKQQMSDGSSQLFLNTYAPFREDCTTLPFDSEQDAALYFLEEWKKGAIALEQDVEIARAILRGDQPLFVYEEQQPDGTLLLSFHEHLPPEGSSVVTFGCRSPRWLARFLLRRVHESQRVRVSEETMKKAQALLLHDRQGTNLES
jgi:hypothetical protein